MSNKLIDLDALSEYKDNADLKYQNKLTAGNCFSIVSNVISAKPTFVVQINTGSQSVASGSVKNLASVNLPPGNYILVYTCQFSSNSNGYRQCSFARTASGSDNLGAFYIDRRKAVSGTLTTTSVFAIFQVSATDYPNGRTFYFNARQNSGSSLTAYPRAYYIKF